MEQVLAVILASSLSLLTIMLLVMGWWVLAVLQDIKKITAKVAGWSEFIEARVKEGLSPAALLRLLATLWEKKDKNISSKREQNLEEGQTSQEETKKPRRFFFRRRRTTA